MSGVVQIVVIAAAVCYMLVRRLMGEPVQAKRMLVLPAVLVIVGLTSLSGVMSDSRSVLLLVLTAAISIVIGALRGMSVRISQRDGLAFVRYTWVTVALWAANIAVKLGVNVAFGAGHGASLGNSMLLTLAGGLLAEGLVVLYRALRDDHQVAWARGRDGAAHQTSPMLDNLRHNLANRDGGERVAEWNTHGDNVRR